MIFLFSNQWSFTKIKLKSNKNNFLRRKNKIQSSRRRQRVRFVSPLLPLLALAHRSDLDSPSSHFRNSDFQGLQLIQPLKAL
ncbi:hypothetical protein ACET3Z_026617 [Daucus carota]